MADSPLSARSLRELSAWRRSMPSVDWAYRVVYQAIRRFRRDQCTMAASSLAFQTALALVPLLVVGFALLKATGQLDATSNLLQFLGQQILPSSDDARDEIVQRLAGFTANMTAGALGGFGLALTLITGFLVFVNTEAIWNRIWCAERQRTFLHKFLLFYAAITLGPFLAAVSLLRTATFFTHFTQFGPASYVISLLTTPLLFVVLNRALPVTRVSPRAAVAGGLAGALLFELAKYGFGLYLAFVTVTYRSVYGALGILPLFLVWIYVAWLTILFGAEVAHAAQRLPALEAAARHRSDDDTVLVNGATAARLLFDIVAHYQAGRHALPLDVLRQRHALSEEASRRLIQRLCEAGLILPADPASHGGAEAYLPARPAADLRLSDVHAAFADPVPPGVGARNPDDPGGYQRLQRILEDQDQAAKARLAAVSFADLCAAASLPQTSGASRPPRPAPSAVSASSDPPAESTRSQGAAAARERA